MSSTRIAMQCAAQGVNAVTFYLVHSPLEIDNKFMHTSFSYLKASYGEIVVL